MSKCLVDGLGLGFDLSNERDMLISNIITEIEFLDIDPEVERYLISSVYRLVGMAELVGRLDLPRIFNK